MYITWYGLSCLKIESKTSQGEVVVVTDPFDPKKVELRLPRAFRADLVLLSWADGKLLENVIPSKEGESVFYISTPGEYEKGGVYIRSLKVNHDCHLIHLIEVEDLHLLYCGPLHRSPEAKELESIENIDVLFVPIGGREVLSFKNALELVSVLEPRIVIPIHYKLPGLKVTFDGPEAFLKAMGVKSTEKIEKLKISQKDLPEEETKIVLLTPPS